MHALIGLDGVAFTIQLKDGFARNDEKELLRPAVLVQRLGSFGRHGLSNDTQSWRIDKLPGRATIAPRVGLRITYRLLHGL